MYGLCSDLSIVSCYPWICFRKSSSSNFSYLHMKKLRHRLLLWLTQELRLWEHFPLCCHWIPWGTLQGLHGWMNRWTEDDDGRHAIDRALNQEPGNYTLSLFCLLWTHMTLSILCKLFVPLILQFYNEIHPELLQKSNKTIYLKILCKVWNTL